MSDEASPRPWTWDINDDDQLMLYDADGNPLGQLFDHGCESEANLIVDAVNERAQLESLWARKQIHDPTGSEWHANGKLLYTENNDFIGEMEHSDDARFVCDAVNNAPLFDILLDDCKELIHDVDRLRDELADKTRNYEDVIAFHTRTEEHLRDLVKRLAEFVNDTACFTPSDKDDAQSLLREARAAIGEDKE